MAGKNLLICILLFIIITNNECHCNIIVNRLQGCGHSKKLRKVKVSHATVKSFDRRGVSCKNVPTVQFSGGVKKCPATQKTALPLANCSTHQLFHFKDEAHIRVGETGAESNRGR